MKLAWNVALGDRRVKRRWSGAKFSELNRETLISLVELQHRRVESKKHSDGCKLRQPGRVQNFIIIEAAGQHVEEPGIEARYSSEELGPHSDKVLLKKAWSNAARGMWGGGGDLGSNVHKTGEAAAAGSAPTTKYWWLSDEDLIETWNCALQFILLCTKKLTLLVCVCLCVWNLLAGRAHRSPQRGAGQRAWGEEFLPAGERQDPGILGNLKEEPGGGQGWAEEPTEGKRGGRRAPTSGDHCEKTFFSFGLMQI